MFFMRTDKGHKIKQIEQGSIAQQEGICAGDSLLSINGTVMEDIFDYQYQVQNDHVELVLLTKDGEEVSKIIDKDEDDDLGIDKMISFLSSAISLLLLEKEGVRRFRHPQTFC